MEFLDDDARPRYLFQSRPPPSSVTNQDNNLHKPQFNKPLLFITVTISSLSLILSLFFLQTEPFKSLLLWTSLSFLIGPFAPSYITGGDIRVGQGPILEPLIQNEIVEPEKRRKRVKPVRSEGIGSNPVQESNWSVRNEERSNGVLIEENKIESLSKNENGVVREGEEEWSEEDFALLKKQMAKNPVGKVRRWEVIAEAFNGRFKVSSVIKKAKESGEKKTDGDDDSFKRFLKDRKPLDERIQGGVDGIEGGSSGDGGCGGGWSSGEDLALLNALKAFPKDVAMRWEKITASVPGKTKAACMKRVAELKKDFRSSKAAAANES